jgi:hypothetical protein
LESLTEIVVPEGHDFFGFTRHPGNDFRSFSERFRKRNDIDDASVFSRCKINLARLSGQDHADKRHAHKHDNDALNDAYAQKKPISIAIEAVAQKDSIDGILDGHGKKPPERNLLAQATRTSRRRIGEDYLPT